MLIVLFISGLMYSLAFGFFTNPKNKKFVIRDMEDLPIYLKKKHREAPDSYKLLCSHDKQKCVLQDKKRETLDSFAFEPFYRSYMVAKDNEFVLHDYPNSEIDGERFETSFDTAISKSGIIKIMLLEDRDGKWAYMSPHGEVKRFTNRVDMLDFIRQTELLKSGAPE